MANNKKNAPPSISELLRNPDIQAALLIMVGGILIAFLGGTFLKSIPTLQMLAIFAGAVISFTATERIMKILDNNK